MTHLSLFSGIGGIDLAAHWAGFTTVQFVEREPFCQKVLAKNFPGVPIHDDIKTFDGKKFLHDLHTSNLCHHEIHRESYLNRVQEVAQMEASPTKIDLVSAGFP